MDRLAKLRDELVHLNLEIFETLKARASIVSEVVEYKKLVSIPDSTWGFFDPAREKELFRSHLEHILKLSIKELLAFSLIIESHAERDNGNSLYPSWIDGDHLQQKPHSVIEMINPILLATYNRDLFLGLRLKLSFQDKIRDIIF